jgi:hypothetical protein
VQLAQLATGFDAELVDERVSCRLVGRERLGLTAAAVQAQHQLAMNALPQWMLGGERLELANDLGVTAGGKIGVDPLLEGGEPQLLETTDLGLRERLVSEIGERRTAPNGKRLTQPFPRSRRIQQPGLGQERFHAADVELRPVEPHGSRASA